MVLQSILMGAWEIMSYKKKIVVTGSEGLIGRQIVKDLKDTYDIVKLDKQIGHDLNNAKFVESLFIENKHLYGMIICHAHNPLPLKNTKKIEPHEQDLEELRQYFETNTISCFNLCKNFIKNNSGGNIVTISSLYGINSPKHHIYNNFVKPIGYSLSKSSVVIMTKYLASYYAPKFKINCVVLGGVYDKKFDKKFVKVYNENVPFKRMMSVEETTGIFKFLLSDDSSYATGAVYTIDGGWSTW